MKRTLALIAALLMVVSVFPFTASAYAGYTVPNSPVNMPKSAPVIDGVIEDVSWSAPASFSDPTVGHFWASNPLTSEADLYFAYSASGLYFAADITDNDTGSGFVVSTGYDNIDDDGSSHPYGFNGDVMTLMLDPLGLFEKTSYSPAWYNIGIFADNSVKIYRSKTNEADITSSCQCAGAITEDGWRFEVYIPWSVIMNDVSSASGKNFSTNAVNLSALNAVSRCSVMYMDRMPGMTWGRYITVCDKTYDGYNGCATNGISPKSYGIKLVNGAAVHVHTWRGWVTDTEPTCTENGVKSRTCISCNKVEYADIPALGHSDYYYDTVSPTCTEYGTEYKYCGVCDQVLATTSIVPNGHTFGEWVTVTEPTETAHGLKRRQCINCEENEEAIIPAIGAPNVTSDNFLVLIDRADEIAHIRYASGVLNTSSEIKNAPDCVNLDRSVIAPNTVDNVYIRDMPTGGVYTFWIKKNDGSSFIYPVDISYMEQELSSEGVKITVRNLYGVKDFAIAKGDYDTYREVANNKIVTVGKNKIGMLHDYTYTVSEPGIHTVYIRYDDPARANKILKIDLTVTEPEFTYDGLQLHIANLDNVKVIRSALGTYSTSGEIKRADGSRNFAASDIARKGVPYTIQYSENDGSASVCVEYRDGYCKLVNFNVEKKAPTVKVQGTTVVLGNLDGVYVIRYAEGAYSDAAAVKSAPGSKYVRPASVVDGTYTVTGLKDNVTYTFLVQYTENSKNIITVTPKLIPDDDEIAAVGTERQLILEDYTIDYDSTTASLVYNSPVKQSSVFKFNAPYESNDAVYQNIVKGPDGVYRMYYKATSNIRRIAYITSTDGINWHRPTNGYSYNGGTSNIVTHDDYRPDNLFVFYDTNPNAIGTRWKGIYGEWAAGLFCEYSPDGYTFFNNGYRTVLGSCNKTQGSFFDSLNTVYWDAAKGKYVAFVRGFHVGDNYNLGANYVQSNGTTVMRDIRYSESTDFVNWTTPVPITYDDGNDWQMYTNCIAPYFRAPQLYIGTPTRYRYVGGSSTPLTDVFLMSSRDLLNWDRTDDPYMVPNGPGSTYKYGESGYPCVGIIQTGENEMSLYMKEPKSGVMTLYRYTLPLDGFRSANGTSASNKLVTKFLETNGTSLAINYETSNGGAIRVSATDVFGNKVTSDWMSGSGADVNVTFNGTLASLSGDLIKLTFELDNAKLYSYKFN